MAALLKKYSYDAYARSGWHIRKNLLEHTGYDNQSILFYDFGKLSCSSGGEIPMDHSSKSSDWILLFILNGNAIAFCNQKPFQLKKNDVFVFTPTDNIRIRVEPRNKLDVCQLSVLDSPVIRILLARMRQERLIRLKNPEKILSVLRSIENLLQTNLKSADQEVLCDLASLIYTLIAKISLHGLDFESRLSIQQICEEIVCNPWNNYSVAEMAEKSGLSIRSFARQFRKLCGCSYLQYLTGAKIGLACNLLQSTGYSVNEIMTLCNFRSKPGFFQAFKKQTGITPQVFRATRKESYSDVSSLVKTVKENKLTAKRKNILWLLIQNTRITVSEIAETISIQRSAVQKNLEWLKAHNYIQRHGSKRAGYWEVGSSLTQLKEDGFVRDQKKAAASEVPRRKTKP